MSPIPEEHLSPLHGRNVLVVEDDIELASTIAARLDRLLGRM